MPRVPYRAFTMYEEALGLTGTQKVARVLLGVNAFCVVTSFGVWGMSAQSRHTDDVPMEIERKHNEHVREKNEQLLSAMYGVEQRNRQVRSNFATWNR